MSVDTGLEAIEAITNSNIDGALNWARENDVEIPIAPENLELRMDYHHDARDVYPKRMTFIQNICDYLRSTDPDDGIVSGRLEGLAETFRRRAESCNEDGRYSAMDIWIDAETDVKRLIP